MTVLIAGAGPTGLTAACALMQRGVPVRVLDAAEGPASTSRALGLQPRGAEVLNRVGALGDLPERSMDIRRVTTLAGGRPMMELRLDRWAGRGALISQSEIEKSLRDRLSELGGKVEWGTAVTDMSQDAEGITVQAGEPIRGDWLLGCDGSHSTVRKLAGIDFPGVPLAERFLLADVHLDWPVPRDGVTVWLGTAGMFAAFPLPGNDLWRLQGELPGTGPVDVLAELKAMLPKRSGLTAEFGACDWTSTFTIHRRLAGAYRRGRILLAGDAAHVHSPFSGQGMNTGIGDAENLAWKLAMVLHGRATERLIDTYETERRPIAEEVLSGTTALTSFVLGMGFWRRLLRDAVFLPLLNLPVAQRKLFERTSQLALTYRRGPLGPRGDRVPEIASRWTNGRWVLEVPTADDPHVPVAKERLGDDLLVETGPVTRLVRPDGHLAWQGRPAPARLGRWLDETLAS
ncbi:FAD-dependent monooxygenase [Kutzneria kofuensis]|uniref:4,5-epoxidase n=1 Tax=Kutzneria kofuensis TaxID=103725 RepID=A0A7W9NI24_9PSEU|nr:FAD-dependent monooxygenase [Kutzneria kofuensis]MBB5892851.1 4,5-epoxidase [Kutzneria kofuensis]